MCISASACGTSRVPARLKLTEKVLWQTFALHDIEDREALEEEHRLGLTFSLTRSSDRAGWIALCPAYQKDLRRQLGFHPRAPVAW